MFKVTSLLQRYSKFPRDVTELETSEEAKEFAEHMSYVGGYYVIVQDGEKFLYDLDGVVQS